MGWFKELTSMFGSEKKNDHKQYHYSQMLNGTSPIFNFQGTDIYASDVVQQTLDTIACEMKKLSPMHVRYNGFDPVPIDSDEQRVLDNPNSLMTTSEFIEKCMWLLLLNYNVFIYIERDNQDKLKGLYPLNPSYVTFMEDSEGKLYLEFQFANGFKTILPYDSIIHIKSHYSKNDLMGGDTYGKPDNRHIEKTVKINDMLLEGVRKAMEVSCTISGIVQYNTMLDNERMENNIRDFETKLNNSKSGLIPLDTKASYVPIDHNVKMVDEATLCFIDDKIMRNWHVDVGIGRGKYTAEEYESFYQSALEAFIISFSQGFTKKIFTKQQAQGYHNEIIFYPKELIFMSSAQTIAVVNILAQSGAIFENEKRVAFGFAPSKDLVGKRVQSLNWVDVEHAKEYQMKGVKNVDG